jgi:hypothetical protein
MKINALLFCGWNSGILRREHLFLANKYNSSFELFSVHIQRGTERNIALTITLFNFSWVIGIRDGR